MDSAFRADDHRRRFGGYPRLSVPFILEVGARFHVLPFFCCAFLITPRRVRQLLYCVAGGAVLLLLLCVQLGELAEGRLGLPLTQLVNPNELAFAIIFGMPCLLLLAYARSGFAQDRLARVVSGVDSLSP